jgi:hypothetical protein
MWYNLEAVLLVLFGVRVSFTVTPKVRQLTRT